MISVAFLVMLWLYAAFGESGYVFHHSRQSCYIVSFAIAFSQCKWCYPKFCMDQNQTSTKKHTHNLYASTMLFRRALHWRLMKLYVSPITINSYIYWEACSRKLNESLNGAHYWSCNGWIPYTLGQLCGEPHWPFVGQIYWSPMVSQINGSVMRSVFHTMYHEVIVL